MIARVRTIALLASLVLVLGTSESKGGYTWAATAPAANATRNVNIQFAITGDVSWALTDYTIVKVKITFLDPQGNLLQLGDAALTGAGRTRNYSFTVRSEKTGVHKIKRQAISRDASGVETVRDTLETTVNIN